MENCSANEEGAGSSAQPIGASVEAGTSSVTVPQPFEANAMVRKMKGKPTTNQNQSQMRALDHRTVELHCNSISIGSNEVTSSDTGFEIPVTISALGIRFKLPYANQMNKQKRIYVLNEFVKEISVTFDGGLLMIISANGDYAKSLRENLGLHENLKSKSGSLFNKLDGRHNKDNITFIAAFISEAEMDIIKSLWNLKIQEINDKSAKKVAKAKSKRSPSGKKQNKKTRPSLFPKIVSTFSKAPLTGTNSATAVVASSSFPSSTNFDADGAKRPRLSSSGRNSVPASVANHVGDQETGRAREIMDTGVSINRQVLENQISAEVEQLAVERQELSTEVEKLTAEKHELSTEVEKMTLEKQELSTEVEKLAAKKQKFQQQILLAEKKLTAIRKQLEKWN